MIKIVLSTDGKHTVWVEADGDPSCPEYLDDLYSEALRIYQKIEKDLGTKADMWEPVMNGKKEKVPNCPQCGAPMEKRKSKKNGGFFWGCSNFPKCRATIDIPA